jgi:threonine/homoserine/homoserine lactone efflux protein
MFYYLFSGITLGLSAGLSPGPLLALVLSETLAHGKRAGISVALAPFLTDLPIILLSLLMIDFLSSSHIAFGILSFAGALYLLWLARENFQVRQFKVNAGGSSQSLKKGIVVNFLNPGPYLFWISVGSPIMIKGWQLNILNPALFLAGFYIFLVGSKVLIAVLVGVYRARISDPLYRMINLILGVMLILISLKFFYDGYVSWTEADF